MFVNNKAIQRNVIREQRAKICFPIINRGRLWYDRLTEEQVAELRDWYSAWLDAPDTLIVPKTPEWVNLKTTEEEILL